MNVCTKSYKQQNDEVTPPPPEFANKSKQSKDNISTTVDKLYKISNQNLTIIQYLTSNISTMQKHFDRIQSIMNNKMF